MKFLLFVKGICLDLLSTYTPVTEVQWSQKAKTMFCENRQSGYLFFSQ